MSEMLSQIFWSSCLVVMTVQARKQGGKSILRSSCLLGKDDQTNRELQAPDIWILSYELLVHSSADDLWPHSYHELVGEAATGRDMPWRDTNPRCLFVSAEASGAGVVWWGLRDTWGCNEVTWNLVTTRWRSNASFIQTWCAQPQASQVCFHKPVSPFAKEG